MKVNHAKQCCHVRCSNSRVTFEDAVIVEFKQIKRGRKPPAQSAEFFFGFYCQSCREEDSRLYERLKEEGGLETLRGPSVDINDMSRLEIEEEQFPSHAQERLALMRLTPESFYHPEIGIKGSFSMMVYCKPPVILENVNGSGS